MDWAAATTQILLSLDIAATYRSLGVRVIDRAPSDQGWQICHAYGREDAKPSAAINVGQSSSRGRYKDHATGTSLSLFDFCATYFPSRFHSWRDARAHFGRETATKMPRGRPSIRFDDCLTILRWSDNSARIWSRFKAPLSVESMKLAGAIYARWPAKSPPHFGALVFAFPGMAADDLEGDPIAYCLYNSDGGTLRLYNGAGKGYSEEKTLQTTGSKPSLLNRFALANLKAAEVVWKVEGTTDMLALQTIIPTNLRKRHVVITNNGGASQIPLAAWVQLLAGKQVNIVHDCDTPGQNGAARWCAALSATSQVRNVVLPYPIIDKHGKDLRDFLGAERVRGAADGGWNSLLTIADAAPLTPISSSPKAPAARPAASGSPTLELPYQQPSANGIASHGANGKINGHDLANYNQTLPSEESIFLTEKLGLEILGEHADDSIECYSHFLGKLFSIQNIAYLHYPRLIQHIGQPALDYVCDFVPKADGVASGKIPLTQLRAMIAKESSGKALSEKIKLGSGIWRPRPSDPIILVNSNQAATFADGQLLVTRTPRVGTAVIDFAPSEPWCDFHALKTNLSTAAVDARSIYAELLAICRKWYWKSPIEADIVCSLIFCTWIQTLWKWRPHIAIVGKTSSGKSLFMEEFLQYLYGSLVLYAFQPSEAGIRQQIRNTSAAVILDEFEDYKQRGAVLSMARSGSRGGKNIKGSINQKGISFLVKHMIWIGAIEPGLRKKPDRDRFITLELTTPPVADFGRIQLPTAEEATALGLRCLAVSLHFADVAMQLADSIRGAQVGPISGRTIETYSVPASMYAAIHGEAPEAVLARFIGQRFAESRHDSEEQELLEDILGAQIWCDNKFRIPVSELISDPVHHATYLDEMERNGCCATSSSRRGIRNLEDCTGFFVYPRAVQRYLLRGTRWQENTTDIETILRRHPLASPAQRTIGGVRRRGLEFPLDQIVERKDRGRASHE